MSACEAWAAQGVFRSPVSSRPFRQGCRSKACVLGLPVLGGAGAIRPMPVARSTKVLNSGPAAAASRRRGRPRALAGIRARPRWIRRPDPAPARERRRWRSARRAARHDRGRFPSVTGSVPGASAHAPPPRRARRFGRRRRALDRPVAVSDVSRADGPGAARPD